MTLSNQVSDLLAKREFTDWTPLGATSALEDLIEYGDAIDGAFDEETTVSTAPSAVIGTGYVTNTIAVHHTQRVQVVTTGGGPTRPAGA